MERNEHEYGKPNPNAPRELSQFAFLVGKWRGDARLKQEDGTWANLKALWEGRYILDGYAIADEYRMTTQAGELVVLGMNLRAYDARKRAWEWSDSRNRSGDFRCGRQPEYGLSLIVRHNVSHDVL